MPAPAARQITYIKAALFALLLLPSAYALGRVLAGQVAEPGDYLTHVTGETALRLLMATLLITPLITVSGWRWLIKLRRMTGLYVFYYALLHFAAYLLLDLQLDFALLAEDIAERTYITVGFAAFALLIPLAVTSNDFLIQKLGARRWRRLHQAVYVIAPLAILHYWWQIKNDAFLSPLIYFIITVLLLAMRHPAIAKKIRRR